MAWDLLLRFRKAAARFEYLLRFLDGLLVHDAQKTSTAIKKVGKMEMDKLRMCELGYVPLREEILATRRPYMLRHMLTDVSWRVRNKMGFDEKSRLS